MQEAKATRWREYTPSNCGFSSARATPTPASPAPSAMARMPDTVVVRADACSLAQAGVRISRVHEACGKRELDTHHRQQLGVGELPARVLVEQPVLEPHDAHARERPLVLMPSLGQRAALLGGERVERGFRVNTIAREGDEVLDRRRAGNGVRRPRR